MTPRLYQSTAIDALFAYWRTHAGNPVLVAPTGSGKSLLLAELFRRLRGGWPDLRMLAVTHVRELIRQDFQALLKVWPTAPVGIYSAGLGSRSICNPITFCGIQSVYNKALLFGHIDVMAIDEAHLIGRRSNSMYGQFIAALRAINPDMKLVGFSATPYRMDSGRLDQGKDRLFDGIAYEIGILDLVEQGYLAPLVTKATVLKLDVSGVHIRGGEFIESELQKAVDTESATQAAVMEMIAYGRERKAWKVFCAGVEHARHVADFLRVKGINAGHVNGAMVHAERDQIIGAFREGQLRALCSANLLTTGFDYPGIDLIANLSPTKSTGRYVQKLGRGMRTADGKENCLVLDYAGDVVRHGPVDAVRVKAPTGTTGPAPVKTCPSCSSILHASKRVCPDCGFEFPAFDPDIRLQETASTAAVMSRDMQPEWLNVQGWRIALHENRAKGDSVRVEYRCGLSVHKEWLRFDNPPSGRARQWWAAHGGGRCPASVLDALKRQGELRAPSEILVRRAGKYFEVASRRFSREREVA